MKTFKEYLAAQMQHKQMGSPAPFGVLFLNGGKTAVVGLAHAQDPQISPELRERVKGLAAQHGKYYEGDGGDIAPLEKSWGKKEEYAGGWDDMHAQTYKKVEPHHLSVLFGNGNPEQIASLTNPRSTIFDHLMKNPHLTSYLGHKSFDKETLTTFLQQAGKTKDPSESADLLAMSQQPATRKNVERFIKTGNKIAYPTGPGADGRERWLSYPNAAGKMSKKLSDGRNKFIMSRPGVYFAGAGHLDEIMDIAKKEKTPFELHGGELSQT